MEWILRIVMIVFVSVFAATIFIVFLLAVSDPDKETLNFIYWWLIIVISLGIVVYGRFKKR